MVVGATGLVGRLLVEALASNPHRGSLRVLVRRPPAVPFDAGVEVRVDPPSTWGDPRVYRGADTLFCALGTTLRRAGSPEAFREVDLRLVEAVARGAAGAGVPHIQVVSSTGADPSSRFLYPRTKGEMEASVRALPFQSVLILRPSLLLGARAERRPGEQVAAAVLRPISPLLRGPLASLRPIEASAVARAMVRAARDPLPGVTVLESAALRLLASG